jgi:hypothetical protein
MMRTAERLARNDRDMDLIEKPFCDIKTAETRSLDVHEEIEGAVGFEWFKRFYGFQFFNEKISALLGQSILFNSIIVVAKQRENNKMGLV